MNKFFIILFFISLKALATENNKETDYSHIDWLPGDDEATRQEELDRNERSSKKAGSNSAIFLPWTPNSIFGSPFSSPVRQNILEDFPEETVFVSLEDRTAEQIHEGQPNPSSALEDFPEETVFVSLEDRTAEQIHEGQPNQTNQAHQTFVSKLISTLAGVMLANTLAKK